MKPEATTKTQFSCRARSADRDSSDSSINAETAHARIALDVAIFFAAVMCLDECMCLL